MTLMSFVLHETTVAYLELDTSMQGSPWIKNVYSQNFSQMAFSLAIIQNL